MMTSYDDMLLQEYSDDVIYEDEYMKVFEVLLDIPTHSPNWVKRVQLLNWKNKNNDLVEFDIRRYNKKTKKYGKGVTFSKRELDTFKSFMEDFDSEKLNTIKLK